MGCGGWLRYDAKRSRSFTSSALSPSASRTVAHTSLRTVCRPKLCAIDIAHKPIHAPEMTSITCTAAHSTCFTATASKAAMAAPASESATLGSGPNHLRRAASIQAWFETTLATVRDSRRLIGCSSLPGRLTPKETPSMLKVDPTGIRRPLNSGTRLL